MPVIGDYAGLALDKILVATDFSDSSRAAVSYAEALAKHFRCHVTVVHVLDHSVLVRMQAEMTGTGSPADNDLIEVELARTVSKIRSQGLKADDLLLNGKSSIARQILSAADEINADVIVVGTHSRRGIDRLLLGSCAETLMRSSRRPVLTIGSGFYKDPADAVSFKSVVFATDFSSSSALQASLAFGFVHESRGHLYLCHVLEHVCWDTAKSSGLEDEFKAELMRLVPETEYEWCSPESVVEYGNVADRLVQLCERVSADLLVLGSNQSAPWTTHLMDGTLGSVLQRVSCPTLTLHG